MKILFKRNCRQCGSDRGVQAEHDKPQRVEAKALFNQCVEALGDRDKAIEAFSIEVPNLARAIGVLDKSIAAALGFCPACLCDLRTPEQQEEGGRQFVRECVEKLGRNEALRELHVHAPNLIEYVE